MKDPSDSAWSLAEQFEPNNLIDGVTYVIAFN